MAGCETEPLVLGEAGLVDAQVVVLADAAPVKRDEPTHDLLVVVVAVDDEVGDAGGCAVEQAQRDVDDVVVGCGDLEACDESGLVVEALVTVGDPHEGVFVVPEERLWFTILAGLDTPACVGVVADGGVGGVGAGFVDGGHVFVGWLLAGAGWCPGPFAFAPCPESGRVERERRGTELGSTS